MKLNLDCVREVLLFLEDQDFVVINEDGDFKWTEIGIGEVCNALPHYDPEDIFYTLYQLSEADLIDCTSVPGDDSVILFEVNCITFYGHEYLEGIRDSRRWAAIKTAAEKVGNMSLKVVSAISEGLGNALLSKIDFAEIINNLPFPG